MFTEDSIQQVYDVQDLGISSENIRKRSEICTRKNGGYTRAVRNNLLRDSLLRDNFLRVNVLKHKIL